jgi:AraC-like DNA-binding protein
MRVEPALTARAFLPLVSGLRRLGHDPAPLLGAVGIDPAALEDPDARIPMRAGSGLLTHAAAAIGDDCIGLHIAEHADLRTVDAHFYAMAASATLQEAYERLSRYQRLIHETTRIEVSTSDDGLTLRHILPGGGAAARQTAEFLIAAWLRTGRLITRTAWNPKVVRFAHAAPSDTREHERFFGASLQFRTGENSMTIPGSTASLACVGADPALASLIDRYAAQHMPPPSALTLADRVREVLSANPGDREPAAAVVAARMKMSVRTLNRSLAAEGTTYRELLDRVRHELATRYLGDRRMSIGEVAFLLGFSELSAFSRAFKRWTGQTPAVFRTHTRPSTPTRRHTPRSQ